MIVLRIAGALLLTFSGAFAARLINAAASRSLLQTEGFISFIRFTKVQIDCLRAAMIIWRSLIISAVRGLNC